MDFINAALQLGIDTTLGKAAWTVAGVVLLAKCITIWTPSKSDDVLLDKGLKVLNTLAMNFLKDRNKDA